MVSPTIYGLLAILRWRFHIELCEPTNSASRMQPYLLERARRGNRRNVEGVAACQKEDQTDGVANPPVHEGCDL
jgi:hypothetical protein